LSDNATLIRTEPIPPTQPSALRKIFMGKDGLRAGWSLLVFIAIIAAIAFSANRIAHRLYPSAGQGPKPGSEVSPAFLIIGEAIPFLIVLFVTWVMSKIEHRPNSVYGLGGSRKLPHFFAGLAWGVVCLSLLILTLVKTGLLVIDSRLLSGIDILRYGAIWLFGFLLVGLLEEYLVRGYLQYTLTRGLAGVYQWAFKTRYNSALGFWTSAVIFSVLFGLSHGSNPGESPIGLLSAGLAALVFCFSLWRTGSLWWAIGFHTSWDWRQRDDGSAPSARHPPRGQAHHERRNHGPRRQRLYPGRFGPCQPHHSRYVAPCNARDGAPEHSTWLNQSGKKVSGRECLRAAARIRRTTVRRRQTPRWHRHVRPIRWRTFARRQ
jgi:membrane protease YdiL (CAAX protease family)